ncbi:MAG: type II toxin-antitoxin system Phd/YefM family antitoxin [Acetobacteraceae bacterium]
MTQLVNIYDAKTQLSRLVDRAAAGEEILIARAGTPLARLMPLSTPAPREPGLLRGLAVPDAAFAPLDPDEAALWE